MSQRPISAQREVCTEPGKACRRCKQCPGCRVRQDRQDETVTARRRHSSANIRLGGNPRNFRLRNCPVPRRTGAEGSSSNTCISALSACRPESEPIRDTRPSSDSPTESGRCRRRTACDKTRRLHCCWATWFCRSSSACRVFLLRQLRCSEVLAAVLSQTGV